MFCICFVLADSCMGCKCEQMWTGYLRQTKSLHLKGQEYESTILCIQLGCVNCLQVRDVHVCMDAFMFLQDLCTKALQLLEKQLSLGIKARCWSSIIKLPLPDVCHYIILYIYIIIYVCMYSLCLCMRLPICIHFVLYVYIATCMYTMYNIYIYIHAIIII